MAHYYLKYVTPVSSYPHHQKKRNTKINRKLNLLCFLASFICIALMIYIPWHWLNDYDYHNMPSVLYAATNRTIWAICWAYVLFTCAIGHGGIIGSFLSLDFFIPLSKLSYQVYLYHLPVMSFILYQQRETRLTTNYNQVRTKSVPLFFSLPLVKNQVYLCNMIKKASEKFIISFFSVNLHFSL